MKNITFLTVKALKHSIAGIRTPSAFVTEPEFIEEFLTSCDRTVFTKIRDHVIQLRTSSDLKPVKLTCTECSHEYEQQLSLDMANFFAPAS